MLHSFGGPLTASWHHQPPHPDTPRPACHQVLAFEQDDTTIDGSSLAAEASESGALMPRFEFDPTASLMTLDGRSNVHAIHAETNGLMGWIQAEVVTETGQVEVEAGTLEIPFTRLSSGNALYDVELRRRIDIRRYPTAAAVLSDWQPTAKAGSYRVGGQVSFRGLTRAVEGDMSLSVEDDCTLVLDGARLFDIRDFGMEPPRLLSVRVHPEVTIQVAVVGRRIG